MTSSESKDSKTVVIEISGVDPIFVFGPEDKLLRTIEESFPDVRFTARGNEIEISGPSSSVSLAEQIETQFRDRVGRKSRGVKQGPFYVLWTPSMPSVLVELGFLSNSEEEKFLMSQEGKEYMASAIYRSIRDYKESIEAN